MLIFSNIVSGRIPHTEGQARIQDFSWGVANPPLALRAPGGGGTGSAFPPFIRAYSRGTKKTITLSFFFFLFYVVYILCSWVCSTFLRLPMGNIICAIQGTWFYFRSTELWHTKGFLVRNKKFRKQKMNNAF